MKKHSNNCVITKSINSTTRNTFF